MTEILAPGPDGRLRCWWGVGSDERYLRYHDEEWGRPVVEEAQLFEMLTLEGFQAGLSWSTILRKREAFRAAFAGFDPAVVAGFGEADVGRLLLDSGIVRHRGKVEAAIGNARGVLAISREHGSLAAYFWRHAVAEAPAPRSAGELASETPQSRALSGDLRRRGLRFVGPTIVYAFMQAVGLVNDHAAGCAQRDTAEAERHAVLARFPPSGAPRLTAAGDWPRPGRGSRRPPAGGQ